MSPLELLRVKGENEEEKEEKRKDRSNAGKAFEAEIRPLLTSAFSYTERIPDTRFFRFSSGHGNLITPKTKADFVSFIMTDINGRKTSDTIYWECKSSERPISYLLSTLGKRKNQVEWARVCSEGQLGVNVHFYYIIGNRSVHGDHYAMFFHGSTIVKWLDEGVSSMKWRDLERSSAVVLNKKGEPNYGTDENVGQLLEHFSLVRKNIRKVNYEY